MQKDSILHSCEPAFPTSRLLSIVVPAFNEEEVLTEFQNRLAAVLNSIPISTEIIYVNDGSTDKSLRLMNNFREKNPDIAIVDLSRNFGKEVALSAGLDHANGDAVVFIDADLQDPPELIPDLVKCWEEGYDVVNANHVTHRPANRLQCKYRRLRQTESLGY